MVIKTTKGPWAQRIWISNERSAGFNSNQHAELRVTQTLQTIDIFGLSSSAGCSQTLPSNCYIQCDMYVSETSAYQELISDRKRWWISSCKVMEKVVDIGNSCNLYRLIRSTGPEKPSLRWLRNSMTNLQKRRIGSGTQHFKYQLNWPNLTARLLLGPQDETPLLEMRVTRETGLLKRHMANELNRIFPSFFKDSGKVLTRELANWWDLQGQRNRSLGTSVNRLLDQFTKASTGSHMKTIEELVR